jgi:Fur family transcriptional regulator, peroxide stress response regulator
LNSPGLQAGDEKKNTSPPPCSAVFQTAEQGGDTPRFIVFLSLRVDNPLKTAAMTYAQKLEQCKQRCKERGVKLTLQRIVIYERLIQTTEHPTVEQLHARVKQTLPTITLDTVRRALMTFCELGVASMVEGAGSPKRFEGNMDVHHHACCVQCGRILDFYHDAYDHLAVPTDVQQEFQILKTTVHIEGICRSCRQTQDD